MKTKTKIKKHKKEKILPTVYLPHTYLKKKFLNGLILGRKQKIL